MKEKLKNKKVVYTIIGIVSVLLVALAVTYAYWLVTKTQTGENEISSACLDISISGEKNDIELTNQFPMSDEDGMKLVPYEFTVTNNCNTSVDYQVALEAIGDSSNALKATSLKVALNNNAKLYSAYPEVETTISGAYESRVLGYSKLAAAGSEGSSDTYELRIWIDKNAPISEMNKTFKSKISITVGQGIESPYEEGTLAYDILANYSTGSIKNLDNDYEKIVNENTLYYSPDGESYTWGTEYTLNEKNKEYTLSGELVTANIYECVHGKRVVDYQYDDETGLESFSLGESINCGRYTLKEGSSTYNKLSLFEITDANIDERYIKVLHTTYVSAFETKPTNQEVGLYKTQDDLGDSYYFRGSVANNYVEFGTYAEDTTITEQTYGNFEEQSVEISAGTPMYWRIVRINGDGTIRLLYDGTTKTANETINMSIIHDGQTYYNTNYDNAKYVGYTYDDGTGTQVDSTIKEVVDTWYDTHLETNYGDKIADSIFCNDRSEASYTYYDENYSQITDPNAAVYTDIYYGAYKRLYTDKAPSLKCTNKTDRYTVDDTTNGNGYLSNPIGLLTADEVVYAGEGYSIYNGFSYWLGTASYFSEYYEGAHVWAIDQGSLSTVDVIGYETYPGNVRPVINLKANVEFTGDGSFGSPYKIVTE